MERVKQRNTFLGYAISGKPLYVSVVAIFAALVCVITSSIQIPFGPTNGYFNFGDGMVMISGLIFGPWVGAFAGGIGSMVSDIISPYPLYAPLTLLAKGLEGFFVGLIANPRGGQNRRIGPLDVVGAITGGIAMVAIYFVGETLVYTGIGPALEELPGNFFLQCCIGVIVAILVVTSIRKYLLDNFPMLQTEFFAKKPQVFLSEGEAGQNMTELICAKCGSPLTPAPLLGKDVQCPECGWSVSAKDSPH